MAKTILIASTKSDPYFAKVEDEIFARGFQTLSVRSLSAALDRVRSEMFGTVIFDSALESKVGDFMERLSSVPMGALTPVVLIERDPSNPDRFGKNKTILDQHFNLSDTPPDSIAEYIEESIKAAGGPPKKGHLSNVAPPVALFSGYTFNITGALTFENEDEKRTVYFDKGNIVFADSNRKEDLFGEFLIRKGVLSREQLEAALKSSSSSGVMLGNVLVRMGFLRPDLLFPLVQEQVKHIIFSAFSWKQGTFTLTEGEQANREEAIFNIPASSCVVEGVKRAYSSDRLIPLLSPLGRTLKTNRSYGSSLHELHLSPAEKDLVALIDGQKSVNDIISVGQIDSESTLQLIFALCILNVCHFEDENEEEEVSLPTPVAESKPIEVQSIAETMAGESIAKEEPKEKRLSSDEIDRELAAISKSRDKEKESEASTDQTPAATAPKPAPQKPALKAKPANEAAPAIKQISRPTGDINPNEATPIEGLNYQPVKKTAAMRPRRARPAPRKSRFGLGLFSGIFLGVLLTIGSLIAVVYFVQPELRDSPGSTTYTPPSTKKELAPYVVAATSTPTATATPRSIAKVRVVPSKPVVAKPKPKPKRVAQKRRPVDEPDVDQLFLNYVAQGKREFNAGNPAKALASFRKALKIQPKNDDLLVQMANCYFDLDRIPDSFRYLRAAIKINPRNSMARLSLGSIYLVQQRKQEAITEYKNFLKLSRDVEKRREVKKILTGYGVKVP